MATLGIDASNIQGGGGVTHLVELLSHANPSIWGFDRVVVWGGQVLDSIEERDWLIKRSLKDGKLSNLEQVLWMRRGLVSCFKEEKCSLLFSPGGTFYSRSIPYVSMSQNMLLYESAERRRFPFGWNRMRYNLLRTAQRRSFSQAAGILYISDYAKNVIEESISSASGKKSTVVYHGISDRFRELPSQIHGSSDFKGAVPTILYVSRVNYYKHQWNVLEAVDRLNSWGVKCRLRLVGGGSGEAMNRLRPMLESSPNVDWVGEVNYDAIEREYLEADIFVFASTCENMPNIVLEAMGAGLPVVSSSFGPMPEVLGDSAVYCDPLSVDSLCSAIRRVLDDVQLREVLRKSAVSRAADFSWNDTANQTFEFFDKVMLTS
ncbi:glycosyltransferase family 4 protein [Verrucomicrobiales bacterium]|nr:glycosyltransferase family 4 protein [Verrucomicrobiales bacterium]